MTADSRELRADCARCCGLCCVAPAFDAAQGFGYDKPAHRACVHLDDQGRCGIHATRDAQGFRACAAFDCFGAGQWVTQRLNAGRSWREARSRAGLFEAYRRFRDLHEALAAIELVASTTTAPTLVARLRRQVEDACAREEAAPGSVDLPRIRTDVFARLRALPRDARGRR